MHDVIANLVTAAFLLGVGLVLALIGLAMLAYRSGRRG